MKILLILIIFLVACNNAVESETPKTEKEFSTIRIEGCQYIVYQNATSSNYTYVYAITHKGNCDNHVK